MNKPIVLLMWAAVCLSLGIAAVYSLRALTDRPGIAGTSTSDAGDPDHPGVAYGDVPWKHFQLIPRFQLTDQTDNEFDTASLAGKPYAVSFFFASCPGICRELNERIAELNKQLKDSDITFVSITVDATVDTPEVLGRYSKDFDATPDRWVMLTGKKHEITQLGSQVFRVNLTPENHTEDIILIDKWGRWRDRFKWNDPYDMKRFVKAVKKIELETEPPIDSTFRTRNLMAGVNPTNLADVPWIRDFRLTTSEGESFFSKDMTGEVWIANFFFSTCPGICKEQNKYLLGLSSRLDEHPATIVSITTRPDIDTEKVLEAYRRELGAVEKDNWIFCTGDDLLIRRTSGEFFGAHSNSAHHSSLFFVVDRWGNVRGSFDWQKPEREVAMLDLIDQLNAEQVPTVTFDFDRED